MQTNTFQVVDFSKEELLQDLRDLMVDFLRMVNWAAGDDALKALVKGSEIEAAGRNLRTFNAFEMSAEDLEFDISGWPIAESFDELYDYAAFGLQRFHSSELEFESRFTFQAALIFDLLNSTMLDAINGETHAGHKCLRIAQIAAARAVLEGHSRFVVFNLREDSDGELTIRDVALLAGMEEASVRNAANPKNPNPLVTTKDGHRTFVTPENARSWLESRGRYVPIKFKPDALQFNLVDDQFSSAQEAWSFLLHRASERSISADRLYEIASSKAFCAENLCLAEGLELTDSEVERIADALQLDSTFLGLRLKQAKLTTESEYLEGQIQYLAKRSKGD